MSNPPSIPSEAPLLEALTDLLETAVESCTSAAVLDQAEALQGLCRDALTLSEALAVLQRRAAP